MANQKHLAILKQGVEVWNAWREMHPEVRPDLGSAKLNSIDLSKVNLSQANLKRADFDRANLRASNLARADLYKVDFKSAILIDTDMSGANLHRADFYRANLSGANLSGAALIGADLSYTNLSEANLNGAKLHRAILVRTNLTRAILANCSVYGISVWDVNLDETAQLDLIITLPRYPTITVDNLEVAQFIYLLLNNQKIRFVIDTITSKVVLILGRFTPERKAVLDALRDEVRKWNYTPVVFDFEKPGSRDFTETVKTLAHLSRFIIADLTDPSSIPQELQAIIPDLEVPVQPLLLEAKREYSMFVDFRKYHWVLPIYMYKDRESLIASLKKEIIEPADRKARELAIEKAKRLERP